MKNVFIIAEAGVNHNGKLSNALRLCEIAKSAGADAVKFQTFKTELILTENVTTASYQKENTGSSSQYEMVKALELSFEDFSRINEYCKEIGILFLSTPDDAESLAFLVNDLKMETIKIGSGEVDNVPHLQAVGRLKKKVILSTGMANLEEIENALSILRDAGTQDISLLQCTTSYPCLFKDLNLKVLDTLKNKFSLPVGFSDHSVGFEAAIAAVAMGAVIVEKHFTLDKNLPGPDHLASLDPSELASMIKFIRNIQVAIGTGLKNPTTSELETAKVVRRKIVASKDIEEGEIFSILNITTKRSERGSSASMWETFLGKTSKKKYRRDDPVEI